MEPDRVKEIWKKREKRIQQEIQQEIQAIQARVNVGYRWSLYKGEAVKCPVEDAQYLLSHITTQDQTITSLRGQVKRLQDDLHKQIGPLTKEGE